MVEDKEEWDIEKVDDVFIATLWVQLKNMLMRVVGIVN